MSNQLSLKTKPKLLLTGERTPKLYNPKNPPSSTRGVIQYLPFKTAPSLRQSSTAQTIPRPRVHLSSKEAPSSKAPNKSELGYKEHLFLTFQSMKFIKDLPPVDPAVLRTKLVHLRRRPGYQHKKTLILDMDETLIHCLQTPNMSPDVVLNIQFSNGNVAPTGINVRPHVRECLAEANKLFEVIVFTASQKCYADVVLDFLDPTGTLIHHRLYRDSCISVRGVLVKDLRILQGRLLKDIVIVDNAAYSFANQLDNGVPIISWRDDYADKELFNLIDYLGVLALADDVREVNTRTFHLRTFEEDYANEFMRDRQ